MEGKNEKDIKFLAICFIIIQSVVIGFVAFFVIGIARVDAADYNTLNPSVIYTDLLNSNGGISQGGTCAWNDLSSCNRDLNTTSNQRLRMKFQASYYASASNSIQVNYVVGYKMFLLDQQVNLYTQNMSVGYYSDNSLVKDITSDCTTTAQKVSGTGGTSIHPQKIVYFIMTTTCDFINPGANADNIVITTPLPTAISNIENVYARISSYTLNRITGTVTDSDKIIANNTQNTQWIINNIESGTTTITNSIDNSTNQITNQLTELEESQKDCKYYNYNKNDFKQNGRLLSNGNIEVVNNWKTTTYIKLQKGEIYNISKSYTPVTDMYYCLYNLDKTLKSCYLFSSQNNINITSNEKQFIRITTRTSSNDTISFTGKYCANVTEITGDKTNENLENINGSITDPSIDTSGLSGFNVTGADGGISSIITAPLSAITGILNSTCTDLVIPIPFVSNKNITLPCLTPIYQQHFPQILSIWQVVVTGIIAYWICLNIFHMVHGFTDPNDDKIEVVDL